MRTQILDPHKVMGFAKKNVQFPLRSATNRKRSEKQENTKIENETDSKDEMSVWKNHKKRGLKSNISLYIQTYLSLGD